MVKITQKRVVKWVILRELAKIQIHHTLSVNTAPYFHFYMDRLPYFC